MMVSTCAFIGISWASLASSGLGADFFRHRIGGITPRRSQRVVLLLPVWQWFTAHGFPATRRAVGVVGDFAESFVSHSFCVVDRDAQPYGAAKAAGHRSRRFVTPRPPLR